jgi:hypothetical protein
MSLCGVGLSQSPVFRAVPLGFLFEKDYFPASVTRVDLPMRK